MVVSVEAVYEGGNWNVYTAACSWQNPYNKRRGNRCGIQIERSEVIWD